MATVAAISDTTIVGENEDQLVTMIVDNQLFGIPILQVQDIVEASKITPVPLAPSAIAGVLNLRGRIVTVIDLRKLLGNHDEVPWDSQMGVTVEFKGDLYTLLVDAIGDVRTLPKRDFDSSPSTMEDNVRQLCSGIYRLRGNLLVVLDVSRILHSDVIDATPMLTVEERRSRKEAAAASQDGDSDGRSHQLSALMTDLNSYESDTEGVFGIADSDQDDIKARKRASRDRRPVAERWQEVLEEKARRSGQVAFRMREPDEEVVENARQEMANEDAEWAARVMDPESVPGAQDEGAKLDPPIADAAPDLPESTAPDYEDSMMPGTDEMPKMPDGVPEPAVPGDDMPEMRSEAAKPGTGEPAGPAEDAGSTESSSNVAGGAGSSWWNTLRGKGADAGGGPEKVEDPSAEDAPGDDAKRKAQSGGASAKKGKSAEKKTRAKRSTKSGSKSKASPKSKKKS